MSDQPGCPCSICDKDYMNQSDSRDSAGQSADDVLKTSKHHNFRTRIIAAIAKADQDWCSDNPLHEDMADAVIRELGLEPQAHYDPDCEFYRYVTDWIDPQTNRRVDLP